MLSRAVIASLLAVLFCCAGSPREARTQTPIYDHPLFTGPVHDPPPAIFDLEHLRLNLRFDGVRERIEGTAWWQLFVLEDTLRTFVALAPGIDISGVWIGPADTALTAVSYQIGRDTLRVRLDTLGVAGPLTVRIDYTATPPGGLSFENTRPKGLWTSGAPQDYRYWLPAPAGATDPLTTEVFLTTPIPLTAFASGRLIGLTEADGGRHTAHYAVERPLPLDRLVVVAGPFETATQTALLEGERVLPLTYAVPPARAADATRSFARVPAILRFFSDKLGYDYPWPALALVAVADVHPPAVGTALTVFDDGLLLDDRAALTESPDEALAEALARQWFGTLIAADFGTEAWLPDALAHYLGLLFVEADWGADVLDRRLADDAQVYFAEAEGYRRPLVWDQWMHPLDLRDAHSREKGAWVLHMLRRTVGDEAFWRTLNRFLRSHDYGLVQTGDFVRALEAITGERFGAFFDRWVYAAGHPVLDVGYAYHSDTETLDVTIRQTQTGYLVPEVFEAEVVVEAHTLAGAERFTVALDGREGRFSFPLRMHPRFVLFDAGHRLLAQTRLAQPVEAWMAQLRYAPDPVDRRQAARTLQAYREDSALLIGLRNALTAEAEPSVQIAIAETIGLLPPSPSGERTLLGVLEEDEDPLVRAAVLDALGAFKGSDEVARRALAAANDERSYRVQAAAVRTLARIQAPGALDVLRAALITPSHEDVIRRAAFDGLAALDLAANAGLDLALPYTRPADASPEVRAAAVGYLKTLAPEARRAHDRLVDLLADPSPRVRRAAADALAEVGTTRAVAPLEARLATEAEPRVRHHLLQAIRAIVARPTP